MGGSVWRDLAQNKTRVAKIEWHVGAYGSWHAGPMRPPSPTNGVEAAERAGAFWVAATLDRLWALAFRTRPRINLCALEVHTPWLRLPESYDQVSRSVFPCIHVVLSDTVQYNSVLASNSFLARTSRWS